MVLFPIAFIWLLCVVIWIVRNSMNEDVPGQEPGPRRWFPRPPRRPHDRRPSGSRSPERAHSRD